MASLSGSRFLSACEVEQLIRKNGHVFHVVSSNRQMPREIVSPYDLNSKGSVSLDGFALRPPTFVSRSAMAAFGPKVHSTWQQYGEISYTGVALPGISFIEETGIFRLDSLGPGPYPGDYFLDENGLQHTLQSLATVALQEAVKQHLTEGGDERLHLDPTTGGNKYFCPPHPVEGAILRGSCTCSPPTQYAFDAASALLNRLWQREATLDEAYADVRSRISRALGLETPHHVVLHPSGTDAEYTPLLIASQAAKALGCTGIVNVVVGAGEVGSNTPNAAGGQHFSKYMPNGGTDSKAVLVSEFANGTRVIQLKARGKDASMLPAFDNLVLDTLEEASKEQERPFFIVHAVDGSKLGSHITSRDLVRRAQERYGDRVLVVLDSCQLRTERHELDWYLARNAVVLVTASKFYGAPGFCAAALVPEGAAAHLRDIEGPLPLGLGDYLTKYQVPKALDGFRAGLRAETRNLGLLLRWTCGVTEMERLASNGEAAREAIRLWVSQAREFVRAQSPRLELLEDPMVENVVLGSQLGGVNSIVGFKVRSPDGSRFLDTATLKKVHQHLTADISSRLPASAGESDRRTAAVRCFIGQPVDLGDFAILRLAMGASVACDLADDLDALAGLLEQDARVMDKIMLILSHHEILLD